MVEVSIRALHATAVVWVAGWWSNFRRGEYRPGTMLTSPLIAPKSFGPFRVHRFISFQLIKRTGHSRGKWGYSGSQPRGKNGILGLGVQR